MKPVEREMSRDIINKQLFKICMRGKWNEVVDMYKKDKRAHEAKITRSGETALHSAVSDGQDEVVDQLVNLICSCGEAEAQKALRIQNERGNTALHFAASMGSARKCELIAKAGPSLVSIRNVDGETPLFLAALHGRKEAFLSLHHLCCIHLDRKSADYYSNCTKTDGDTILHCAIAGDYFDLAFQIIHLYEDLANRVDEGGSSPLHLLASRPSAFRSGSRLARFETIIYYCLTVKELKVDPSIQQLSKTTGKDKNTIPDNYQTCVDLFRVIKNTAMVVTNKFPLTRYLIKKIKKFRRTDQTPTQTVDSEAQEMTATNEDKTPTQTVDSEAQEMTATNEDKTNSSGSEARGWSHPLFPANNQCCVDFFKFVFTVILVIFGKGLTGLNKIRRKKEKHVWSAQIMDELLKRASIYEYDDNGSRPQAVAASGDDAQETSPYGFDEGGGVTFPNTIQDQQPSISTTTNVQKRDDEKDKSLEEGKKKVETPILIAAKNGVTEMVEKILELFPVAVHDMDANKKNIVLLAVENRQPHLYESLLKMKIPKESLFRKVDKDGNSALHLAAKLGDYKPWLIPGAALQMHWEIKWYFFVKESMPTHFFRRRNNTHKTPKEIFTETHKELVKSGGEWLNKTSESCSVVAALIATVAFATSSTVPGGVQESTGTPTLEDKPAFNVFAISSLIALCCSVTAVVLFLSILTSRYQEHDFGKNLPRKLIIGLTSLFMSITSMLVSFCAGHFFVLKEKLKYAALPVYAVTCVPVTLFALAQFPLYFDLIWATFKKVPQRSYKTTQL